MIARLLRGSAILLAPLLLAAGCGDDDSDDAATTSDTGTAEEWSFTDDRDVTVTAPEAPQRVVAYHNAAAALIPLGVRPVAVFGGSAPEDSSLLSGLDVSGIESVGDVYGELNYEALAAVDPDLIVTLFDPAQQGPAFGFLEDAEDIAGDIAPIVALDGTADPEDAIGRFEELADALGADLDAPEVAADRDAFHEAVEDLEAAIADNPGLTAAAMQAYPGDGIYWARPDKFASLRLFAEAGLELVEPEGDPGDVNEDFVAWFWDLVSFELGGKYPADLLLVGNNEGAMDAQQITSVETLAAQPAVAAGQTVEWQVLDRYSYAAFTEHIEALTAAVEAADPDVVP